MHESHLPPNPHPFPRAELKAVTIRGHCNVIQRRFIDYDHALTWHCAIYTFDLIPRKWNHFLKMLDALNEPCWVMVCLQWWRFPTKRKWRGEFHQQNFLKGSMMLHSNRIHYREIVKNYDQDKTEFHQKSLILKKKTVKMHLHVIIPQYSGHHIPSLIHNPHLSYLPLYM